MVTLAEAAVRITVANYHRLRLDTQRPTELIDGRILEMNPIGAAHLTVVSRLQQQLAELNRRRLLLVQQPLHLGLHDEPQPDLLVLRWPVELRLPVPADGRLVIEVADSTLARDRNDKLPRYLAAALVVWIVNIADHAAPQLEVYVPARIEPRPQRILTTRQIPVVADPAEVVDLDALFEGLARLPYDEPTEA